MPVFVGCIQAVDYCCRFLGKLESQTQESINCYWFWFAEDRTDGWKVCGKRLYGGTKEKTKKVYNWKHNNSTTTRLPNGVWLRQYRRWQSAYSLSMLFSNSLLPKTLYRWRIELSGNYCICTTNGTLIIGLIVSNDSLTRIRASLWNQICYG